MSTSHGAMAAMVSRAGLGDQKSGDGIALHRPHKNGCRGQFASEVTKQTFEYVS